MDVLNKHGIQYAKMRDEAFDGAQDMHFYYRLAWDLVVDMLACVRFTKHLRYGFHPQYNAESGESKYGEFVLADWMKWVTAALFSIAALTILPVFIGSNATQVQNCGSAHPSLLTFCCARALPGFLHFKPNTAGLYCSLFELTPSQS